MLLLQKTLISFGCGIFSLHFSENEIQNDGIEYDTLIQPNSIVGKQQEQAIISFPTDWAYGINGIPFGIFTGEITFYSISLIYELDSSFNFNSSNVKQFVECIGTIIIGQNNYQQLIQHQNMV